MFDSFVVVMVGDRQFAQNKQGDVRTKTNDGAEMPHQSPKSTHASGVEPSTPLSCTASMLTDLKLLDKEKELLQTEDALEETKADVKKRMDAVDLRRELLRNKEQQYFASLLGFEDFLVKTDTNWAAILKQINAEHTVQEKRKEEATEIRDQSEVVRKKRDILNGFMKKYEPSRVFVLSVINLSEEYEKVKNVADDYTCLCYAYEELLESEAVLQRKLDACRKREIKFCSVRSDRKLAHDIFLEELGMYLEKIKFNAEDLGDAFFATSGTSIMNKMDIGRIHMGIEHMFHLICKKQTFVLKSPGCHLEMMKRIGEFITDWSDVVKEVRQLVAEQKRHRRKRRSPFEKRKVIEDPVTNIHS